MRIATIGFEFRYKNLVKPDMQQTSLEFLLGDAEEGKTIRDMTADDHLLIPGSNRIYRFNPRSYACRISVCAIEPPSVQKRNYLFLRWFGRRFHRVFTYQNELLLALPNARFAAHGMTWVTAPDRDYSMKTRHMSLIASSKAYLQGHRLRHEVAEWAQNKKADIDIMGRGYVPFERKEDGLADYRFSVVIENSREPGYFTEKLVDTLICSCVPIYWGAPDIAHFFDPRGMILCSSKDEILHAVRTVTPRDYEKRRDFITANRQKVLAFTGYWDRVVQVIRDEEALATGTQ